MERLLSRLAEPVDGAGLAALRILLGLILTVSGLRFWAKGWVQEIYVAPRFHFTYLFFEWVRPWPEPFMTLHVAAMAVAGALVAVGLFTRPAALLYFVLFTYAELIEKAAYLNHYYLVSILVLFVAFVPTQAVWSLDRHWLRRASPPVCLGHYALFRAQLAIVYTYAGLAKLNPDWLFRAEPVHTWLRAYAELPLVGPLVTEPALGFVMSYFGLVYDLSAPWLLLSRRFRPLAVAAGLTFHLAISYLFPVGVFSYVMLTGLTSFCEPNWPRRFVSRLSRPHASRSSETGAPAQLRGSSEGASSDRVTSERVPFGRVSWGRGFRWGVALGAMHLLVQLALPLRFLLYPGHVNWTEQGFRFAWRVMLIEKAGHAEFRVRRPASGEQFLVFPKDELTPLQRRQMAVQADMIQEYALHLADAFSVPNQPRAEVRVDSFVAWNGRPSVRFVDPGFNLGAARRSLAAAPWILPAPPDP